MEAVVDVGTGISVSQYSFWKSLHLIITVKDNLNLLFDVEISVRPIKF
jgi:uncharacterized protein (DUF779 family)